MDIPVCIQHSQFLCKRVIKTNPSNFDERLFSENMFVQIMFETRKRNTGFYILRQGVPEGCSSKGYSSFKQIKPWSWHVEVILGVSNSGTGRQAHFTGCP